MTRDDLVPFLDRLVKIAALFKDRLTDDVQELYFAALADLPLDNVQKAFNVAVRSCTFMPKTAELRQLIGAPGGDPELADETAWLEYKQLAKQVGGYGDV